MENTNPGKRTIFKNKKNINTIKNSMKNNFCISNNMVY